MNCQFLSWCDLTAEQQATWVIAVVTTIYTIFTFLLWRTSQRSIDAARQLFVTLNNPYVGIEGAQLETGEKDLSDSFVRINFRNYGKVPVNNVLLKARWGGKLEEVKKGMLVSKLPATTVFPEALNYHPEIMDKADYLRATIDKVDLFLRIELTYKDLDNIDYIHYYVGKYVASHNNFGVLESFAGKANENPFSIEKT